MPLGPLAAALIPVASGLVQNVLGGRNTRAARLYDRPAEQVKRLNEAGLPKAAASNISPGGGVTVTSSLGGEQVQGNIESVSRTTSQKKQQELLDQQIRAAQAEADLAQGKRDNYLNPTGTYQNTNQGQSISQEIAKEGEALKTAQTVNKWMPTEKFQNVMKQGREIEMIGEQVKNTIEQRGILTSEGQIKRTIANYQDSMSMAELENMIARTTGINKENILKDIAISIEYQTMYAKVRSAQIAAQIAGQQLEAAQLGNTLTHLSLPSTESYYKVRRLMDDEHTKKPNLVKAFIYLGMFQPNQSNYNMSMLSPNIPLPGASNLYNLHK